MSRWISKHAGYNIAIRGGLTRTNVNADGSIREVTIEEPLIAQFRPIASARAEDAHESASKHDIEVAHATWLTTKRLDGTPANIRAIPAREASAIGGVATVAFDIDSIWGVFDTAWLGNEDDAAAADAKLRENDMNGVDYVEVVPVKVPAPWPNYDKIKGRQGAGGSVAAQIAKKVAEDGYSIAAVVAYEQANKNRADVIEALEELAAAPSVDVQDDSTLETTV